MRFRVRFARLMRADFRSRVICLLLLLFLGFLSYNQFTCVSNAFPLVWFRRPVRSDFRRSLPNPLLIDTPNNNPRLTWGFDSHVWWAYEFDCVRESKCQVQNSIPHLRPIPYSNQLQLFFEAYLHTRYHIRYQGPHRPRVSQRSRCPVPREAFNRIIRKPHLYGWMNTHFPSTHGPVDRHVSVANRHLNAGRNTNWHLCNSGHINIPLLMRPSRRPLHHDPPIAPPGRSSAPSK